ILEQSEPERFSEMQSEFSETKLGSSDWETFRMRFYGDAKQLITSTKKSVETQLKKLINGDPTQPVDKAKAALRDWPLTDLRAERDKVKKEVGVDLAVQKRYDTMKRSITTSQAPLND